jgi:hypothetical protein
MPAQMRSLALGTQAVATGIFMARRVGLVRMLAPEFAIEIGPELFQYVCRHVHADLNCQRRNRVVRGPIVLVIAGRNRHCGRVADYFRKIEIHPARVLMRPEYLSHRVAEPRQTASFTAPKIAGVLMQDSRENSLCHVIADDEISIFGAQIFRVPLYPLPIRAIVVA